MHLSLRFLGPFIAQLDDEKNIESRAKKIEALLAYLATEADHAHRRDRLVGLLFPEMPDEQARTNLRQTLTRLRRAISDQKAEPSFLLISRESSQFNRASDHFLDIALFDGLLQGCKSHQPERDPGCDDCIEQLSEAVQLYRGPFLEDLAIDDSAAFEEWLLVKRERYKEETLTTLQQLVDFYESRGAYATAADHVRQQLRIEPWKEKAHLQLIRLLAYQGERAAALRQYQALETMLWEELGVEPLAETRALRDQIRVADDSRPYQLPPRNAAFIGRDNELALLHAYLVDPEKRLITLTGPGGSGKTAIAIESGWRAATQFLGPFFHGVFFVPLAGIASAKLATEPGSLEFDPLVTAIAEATGFSFSGPRDPHQQLLRYLDDKSLLLIIDNVEHLISEVRTLLRVLSSEAPGVKILNTSRERLGLNDEWVLDIEGLPFPADDHPDQILNQEWPDLDSLSAQYHAVALFDSLGKKLSPAFDLSYNGGETNQRNCSVAAVQRISQLVQGLPLGIELAASWTRTMNCNEIAEEIEKNLDFLSSTMQDMPPRHQSLRAVFDSSWQLLDEKEQQALRRLSIFHGPFDRPAATAVSGAAMPTISALVDRSLLQRHDQPAPAGSFQLLEVLRQYAAEHLADDPDEALQVREEHIAYYLQFLSRQQDMLIGSEQLSAVAAIRQSIKEIRSAWRWAVRLQDYDRLSEALDALGLFYYMRSWFTEGADLFALATRELKDARENPQMLALWARLRTRQGWFTFLLGKQHEGREQLIESIEALRLSGNALDLAYTLSFTAAALAILGDYEEANLLAKESLEINEHFQSAYGCAIANNILSQIAFQQGDFNAAKEYSDASLAFEREIGNQWSIGFSMANLGRVALALGNYSEAHHCFQESLTIRRALEDKRGQALCLRYLADAALAQNDRDQARRDYETSLALFRSIGSQDETSATLNSLGRLAQLGQDKPAARRYFVEALHAARQAASIPRMLEAVTGLARLLAEEDPQRAAEIATTVMNHPATNRVGREQAGLLLEDLREIPIDLDSALMESGSAADVDTLSDDLLSMFAGTEQVNTTGVL